jgi:hypothetical protein
MKFFASIMAPITKLFKKVEVFEWNVKHQTASKDIKNL